MKKLLLGALLLLSTVNFISCGNETKTPKTVEIPKKIELKRSWPKATDTFFYHEDGRDSIIKINFLCEGKESLNYIENASRAVIGAAEYSVYSKPTFTPLEVSLFSGNKACLIYRSKNSYGTELEGKKFVSLKNNGELKEILN